MLPAYVRPQPACLLTHNLINRLSIIIGYCDLMGENEEQGSEAAKRLNLIRDAAQQMAKELVEYQCKVLEERSKDADGTFQQN